MVESTAFDLPVYWVNVIEQRRLSNQVTDRYVVRHESPHLLKIEQGSATTLLSHRQILPAQLAQTVGG